MNVYSFLDNHIVFNHPSVGQYDANGEGLGSIKVAMTNDVTSHSVAADGNVMVSKIKASNGSVAVEIQQTSDLHKYLLKWFNYIKTANSSEWADMVVTIRNPVTGESITATGVSPQKLPDKPYAAQGQNITWNLMAANVEEE